MFNPPLRNGCWARSFDTFAPMGPYLVSADEIPDPHALDHQPEYRRRDAAAFQHARADLQNSRTGGVPFERGDAGAGRRGGHRNTRAAWDSRASLRAICKPGDEVVIRIEGIGELRNPGDRRSLTRTALRRRIALKQFLQLTNGRRAFHGLVHVVRKRPHDLRADRTRAPAPRTVPRPPATAPDGRRRVRQFRASLAGATPVDSGLVGLPRHGEKSGRSLPHSIDNACRCYAEMLLRCSPDLNLNLARLHLLGHRNLNIQNAVLQPAS